ncbi:MAG: hypothetical protein ABIT58_01600 [Ferruginibacter sp.]
MQKWAVPKALNEHSGIFINGLKPVAVKWIEPTALTHLVDSMNFEKEMVQSFRILGPEEIFLPEGF